MKKLILIFIIISANLYSFGQDLIIESYRYAIEKGYSSTPNFIVITVKNSNTGEIKEICENVSSLYLGLQKEYSTTDLSIINDSLFFHLDDRFFILSNLEVLDDMDFDNYSNNTITEIDSIIQKDNLIDSLMIFAKYKDKMINYPDYYMDIRTNKADALRDSIIQQRELTSEENEILSNINDIMMEFDYSHYYWDSLSTDGQLLVQTWNNLISSDKEIYDSIGEEIDRQESKFFSKYILQFDTLFCHALFKYGVLCQIDENTGETKLGYIIKSD